MNILLPAAGFGGGIVILIVVMVFFAIPMRIFWKLLVNAVVGFLLLLAFNFFGGMLFSFQIDLSPFHALLVGTLGIPGLIILVILQLVLS